MEQEDASSHWHGKDQKVEFLEIKLLEKQAYIGEKADDERSKYMTEIQDLDRNVRFIHLTGHDSEAAVPQDRSRIGNKMIPRGLLNQASQLSLEVMVVRVSEASAVPGSSIAGTNDATIKRRDVRRKLLNMTIFHFHNREVTRRTQESNYKRSKSPVCCSMPIYSGLKFTSLAHTGALYRLEYFLKAPIKPPVLASWPEPVPSSSSSLRIFLASTLPSSTPHWSKLLMSQTAPSVKVRCS